MRMPVGSQGWSFLGLGEFTGASGEVYIGVHGGLLTTLLFRELETSHEYLV